MEHRIPTVTEYQVLRESTSWSALDNKAVKIALSNSLFSVCAVKGHKIIGTGRIIGDGAVYFYIQDLIVLPEFHRMGIGATIMTELEKWLKNNTYPHSFVGLMAAEETKNFYKRFGYSERELAGPGMYKLINATRKK